MAENTPHDNETPKIPRNKQEVMAKVKAHLSGIDISDPARRAILNEISDMVEMSHAPIEQVFANAIALADGLTAVARACEEEKLSHDNTAKRIHDAASVLSELTSEEAARVIQLDKDLAVCIVKDLKFDWEIQEMSDALNDKFAKDNPGFGKLFTEASPEEILHYFDDMEPEEKKRKAREYLPDVADLLDSHIQKMDNLEDMAAKLAEKNKIVHRLNENLLEHQVDEMQVRMAQGQGNSLMEQDIITAKKALTECKIEKQKVGNLEQTKGFFENVAQEKTVERVEEVQERAEEKQFFFNLLETVAEDINLTVDPNKPIEAAIQSFALKTLSNPALLNDEMVSMVKDEIEPRYPEIFAQVEQELATSTRNLHTLINGEEKANDGKKSAAAEELEAQAKSLGSSLRQTDEQPKNPSQSWNQRINNPPASPEKGNNGRGGR